MNDLDEAASPEEPSPPDRLSGSSFPVVGIGSSVVNGLSSLQRLLSILQPAARMAYVVVPHVRPGQPTGFVESLKGAGDMPIVSVEDGMAIEPQRVHVVPAGALFRLADGHFTLNPPDVRFAHRNAVDEFFLSLAEDRGDNAACVILSGTGSDGTIGLRAVKEQGGLTLAQNDAPYDGMMRSAVATGLVDLLVPLDEIPAKLADFFDGAAEVGQAGAATARTAGQLSQIAAVLRAQTGHDFSDYKDKTVMRRVQRRMQVLQITEVDAFIARLRQDPEQVSLLFRDLLIGVTQFFRDPDAFEVLEREVIPKLFEGKGADDSVRIWVAGCSTGEEAYSLAILLRDRTPKGQGVPKLQIFATDIDEQAIETARAGRYPATIAKDVPRRHLERYFAREDGTYRVTADLREICLFSPHNLLRDAPFSKVDLVSCRNMLIYFGVELQNRAVPLFHYALNPKGYLFLGSSESVSQHPRLFNAVDKPHRIFQRSDMADSRAVHFPLSTPDGFRRGNAARALHRQGGLKSSAERLVLERFTPAYVVVNADGDVLHASGRTGAFLELPSGAPDHNVFSMARPGLSLALRTGLQRAVLSGRSVLQSRLNVGTEEARHPIDLYVQPMRPSDGPETRVYMVVFQDLGTAEPPQDLADEDAVERDTSDAAVRQMEASLREVRNRLQTVTQELEASNEELKSSNEELSAMNEELQSTNEELETSKEEMQSINEELQTVNTELHQRVEELSRANNDISNLLENTQIATVFLDRALQFKGFTPAARDLFRLVDSDVGRPLTHVRQTFDLTSLQEDAERVLRTLVPIDRQVRGIEDGRRYLLRMLPYRTAENLISGVVLTFTDMTRDYEAEERIEELDRKLGARIRELEILLDLVPVGVMIAEGSSEPRVRVNAYGARLLGTEGGEITWNGAAGPFRLYESGGRELPRDEQPLQRAARTGEPVAMFEGLLRDAVGHTTHVMLSASPLADEAGRPRGAIAAITDISAHKRLETQQRVLLNELQHRVKNTLSTISSLASRMQRSRPTAEEFNEAFLSRLLAMGRMHDLLAGGVWEGMDLRSLLRAALDFYASADRSNIVLSGEDVMLTADTGTALGMILHELATNAAKYGALSAAGGRLEVSWQITDSPDARRVRLAWVEGGGPAPASVHGGGFGTGFIRRSVEYDLDGTLDLAFEPAGLRGTIEFPLTGREAR